MQEPHAASRRRRPFALVVLASLMLLKAALLLLIAVGLNANSQALLDLLQVSGNLVAFETGIVLVGGAIVLGLSATGLLALRRWGWVLAMVMTGAFVALDIVGFAGGYVSYPWMLLNILTVFYLNQADVREVFGVADAIPGGQGGDAG